MTTPWLLPLLVATGACLLAALRTPPTPSEPPHYVTAIRALACLALLTSALMLNGASANIDQQLLLGLRALLPDHVVAAFTLFTHSGSALFLTPLIALSSLWLVLKGWRREALLLSLSGLGGAALTLALKALFGRPRPALWPTLEVSNFSFPSGHTLGTASCAVALALVVGRLRPDWRRAAVITAGCWIALMALSRMVLGVHWPTDVIAGAALGSALALLVADLPGCRPKLQAAT